MCILRGQEEEEEPLRKWASGEVQASGMVHRGRTPCCLYFLHPARPFLLCHMSVPFLNCGRNTYYYYTDHLSHF
jgi:hypothetical protein